MNDFDKGRCSNCAVFWNCGRCKGVGNKGEDVVYYMYQVTRWPCMWMAERLSLAADPECEEAEGGHRLACFLIGVRTK